MTKLERRERISHIKRKLHDGKITFSVEEIRVLLLHINNLEKRVRWWLMIGSKRRIPWSKKMARKAKKFSTTTKGDNQ